jgi:hypothetical protein
MNESDFFEAVRTIIYRRVSAQTDEHFIDRIHLVGVPDAAAEIAAIFRTGQEALSEKPIQTSDTKGLPAVLREWAGNYEEGSFDTEAGLMGEAADALDKAEAEIKEHLRGKNDLVLAAYPAMDAVDTIRKWCDEQQYANDTITVAKLREMLPPANAIERDRSDTEGAAAVERMATIREAFQGPMPSQSRTDNVHNFGGAYEPGVVPHSFRTD